ncbi:MAG: outer membrane beta-barrel protein [Saprospiraceae bacterium]|nr:outer membrane beta-barrel protein [Saprospiraceae bacterium]
MKSNTLRVAMFGLALWLGVNQGIAQDLTYGFRAGLSYSKFLGDLEMDANGNAVEDYRFASGFHIGIAFNYAITDLFGFRGEFLFTQRGTEYSYEGDSYIWLARATQDQRLLLGKRIQDVNISTANLEVPLLTYFKLGRFEFSGGINLSVLMAASGGGGLNFEGISPSGNAVEPFRITLSYNFVKDEAGSRGASTIPVRIDGTTVVTPSLIGAYYDYDEKNGNLFNTFDVGLTGGLSYYLNEGLYLGGRIIYGLTDVDDNQYDISLMRLNSDNSYVARADKNQNLTFQVSIGFLF